MTPSRLTRLEQGIGWGLIVLVAVMPFHAFLSVWLGSLTGHQSLIQAWKELLVVILAVAAAILIWFQPERLRHGGKVLPLSALIFGIIALGATLLHPQSLSAIIYGIKTDFEFIILFFVALWGSGRQLYLKLPAVILVTSGLVAGFGILHATVLPHDILTHFGYGPDTVAPFQYVGNLSDTIRTPSTLGGPNQLGSFLILPLSLAVAMWFKRPRWSLVLAATLYLGALWYTYSRSAWIGAIVAVAVTIAAGLNSRRQAIQFAAVTAAVLAISLGALSLSSHSKGPYEYFILHSGAGVETSNSTTQHAAALESGLETIRNSPTGSGLGSAGPASFHAVTKLIPEDYYLQVAIETSLAGLLAFLAFVSAAGAKLWTKRYQHVLMPSLIGALAGLSVVNLFLHGWADSSTAFIFWLTAGAAIAGATKRV